MLAPSLADEEPSRHPLPSRSCRAVHCRCRRGGATASSLAVEEPSRRPLQSPSRSHHAVHCSHRRGAITPSLPLRSHRAVHCRRGAVAPYLAIKEPLAVSTDDSGHSSRPSQAPGWQPRPLVWMVVVLPLLTPPPSICRCLSLWHRLSCHVSLLLTPPPPICRRLRLSSRRRLLPRPSRASRPAG